MKGCEIICYGPSNPFGWGECDHEKTNDSDGQKFYGYDNGDGTTTWYDKDGRCDCTTSTPYDEDDD